MLMDLNIVFPKGELSLVCGKLGSGKTLLLLGTCEYGASLGCIH
jgi:ABC-type lipoprotein export system ATPase subunit